ncbi:hypothetical protein Bhyg_11652 [Pseudolycoriella hygida]|uniref:Uncharacterized protein n=1 Tax=Pseudolycoriella hygida TaxID=35572 RepID=A0A9Q0MXA0_9DIPT|nr:hypothetical protein Bhyg_11652 [Pseudolycoriella hygida]
MKHQQVVVDYTVMIKSCLTCLMLAFSGYVLIRLVCTIFALPKWIQKQQELEDMKMRNEAMTLKTKKFVQFLSSEKGYQADHDEENKSKQIDDDANGNDESGSNEEEKKDK